MKSLFVLIVLIPFIFACNSSKSTDNDQVEGLVTENVVPDDVRIIGKWTNDKRGVWFEFNEDGTCSRGKEEEVKAANMKWSINSDTKKLTVTNDGTSSEKVMAYYFKDQQLILEGGQNNKELIFKKAL